jgi:hypothetical protein
MSGVYTKIALKRVEQNKSSASLSHDNLSGLPSPTVIQPTAKPAEPKTSTKPQNHIARDLDALSAPSEKPEKYTTHFEPSLIKKLKIYATERDMKDYQVVKNALLLYFEKNK